MSALWQRLHTESWQDTKAVRPPTANRKQQSKNYFQTPTFLPPDFGTAHGNRKSGAPPAVVVARRRGNMRRMACPSTDSFLACPCREKFSWKLATVNLVIHSSRDRQYPLRCFLKIVEINDVHVLLHEVVTNTREQSTISLW
jgi:hypothetical protein